MSRRWLGRESCTLKWEPLEVPLLGHPQQIKVILFLAFRMRNYTNSRARAPSCLESLHGSGGQITDGEIGLLTFIFNKTRN